MDNISFIVLAPWLVRPYNRVSLHKSSLCNLFLYCGLCCKLYPLGNCLKASLCCFPSSSTCNLKDHLSSNPEGRGICGWNLFGLGATSGAVTDTDLLLVKSARRSSLWRRSDAELSTCSRQRAENNSSTERKQRGFHPLGGAGDRGPPLTARRRLFMEAPTSDPADCMLSGSDYLPMETCFYIPPAPVSREDRQWLTDRVDPGRWNDAVLER